MMQGRALAHKLNGMLTNLPHTQRHVLAPSTSTKEAKASSEIENIITTNDDSVQIYSGGQKA